MKKIFVLIILCLVFNALSVVAVECGDGNLDPGEECDDGNTDDGDGCSSTCNLECVEPMSGLISWWSGDGSADDIVGTNHGTLQNGMGFAPGMVDQAFDSDYVDDWVRASSRGIRNLQELTIDAWVKLDSLPNHVSRFVTISGEKAVIRYDGLSPPDEWYHFYMKIDDGVTNDLRHVWVNHVLQPGVWHHVAGTYDGNIMRSYLDGVEVGNLPITGTVGSGSSIEIASDWEQLDGLIDEIDIFNRALSAGEIQDIYNAGSAGKCKPVCGNSILEIGEACDDGNTNDGDGCSSVCTLETDEDGDGVSDNQDNCPFDPNPNQMDAEKWCMPVPVACPPCQTPPCPMVCFEFSCALNPVRDGVGDVCDNCVDVGNPDQSNPDGDNYGDRCDNCWNAHNNDQQDSDNDCPAEATCGGESCIGPSYLEDPLCGDACDVCPDDSGNDADGDGYCSGPSYHSPALGGNDCDDNDNTIYPGAPEICSDYTDQDCSGSDISCMLMYSPVMKQTDGYSSTSDYVPTEIDAMLRESDLRGPLHCVDEVCTWFGCICYRYSTVHDAKPVSLNNLYNHWSSSYDLDLTNADPGYSNYEVPSPSDFDSYDINVYGREAIFSDPSPGSLDNYIVLQYWFFYPFNDFYNRHEGDWEMIQIILDYETKDPLRITYSWHYGGTTFGWSDAQVEKLGETHPAVYVASGSHASYWSAGPHTFEQDITDLIPGCSAWTDQTSPVVSTRTAYDVSIPGIPGRYYLTAVSDYTGWISWPGYWGEVEVDATRGDRGARSPYYNSVNGRSRWNDPIAYANNPLSSNYASCAGSPVTLHVYDSEGNHVGTIGGDEIDKNMPGLYFYDEETHSAIILTSDDLLFVIEATGEGQFDFAFTKHDEKSSTQTTVFYNDVQMTEESVASLPINDNNPSLEMEIDVDGDGIVDHTVTPDSVHEEQMPVGDLNEDAVQIPLPVEIDADSDGIPDTMDNCPEDVNPDQSDIDGDGTGDECDADADGDGVGNEEDNCPMISNSDQSDVDGDGVGDVCDNCAETSNPGQEDCNDNGIGDTCDAINPLATEIPGNNIDENCDGEILCDPAADWKNHGKFVSCVAHEAEALLEQGLITEEQKDEIVSTAAQSDVGKKDNSDKGKGKKK